MFAPIKMHPLYPKNHETYNLTTFHCKAAPMLPFERHSMSVPFKTFIFRFIFSAFRNWLVWWLWY